MLTNFVPTVVGVSIVEAPGFLKVLGVHKPTLLRVGDDELGRMLVGILRDKANNVSGASTTLHPPRRVADGRARVHVLSKRSPQREKQRKPHNSHFKII
ncbi:fructokinase-2-like [Curcuma longa]|uniref:fructokinase-2-like n=1 Tax=Curcuma longa TaxID=136217 RepID=UPI003D9DB39A